MPVAVTFFRLCSEPILRWSLIGITTGMMMTSLHAQKTHVVHPPLTPVSKTTMATGATAEIIGPTPIVMNSAVKSVPSQPTPPSTANGSTQPVMNEKPDLSSANTIKYEPPTTGPVQNSYVKESAQRVHIYAPTEEEIQAREEFFKDAPRYTRSSEEADEDDDEETPPASN